MLVIISGVESIHKRLIARQVITGKHQFVFDKWEMDISRDRLDIVERDTGNTIPAEEFFSLDSDEEIKHRKGLYRDMIAMRELLMTDEYGMKNHYFHKFAAIDYDLGLTTVTRYEDPTDKEGWRFHYSTEYQDVIDRYKASILKYHPITGIFSQAFIDRIRQDLGPDNVIVYNIIRNPSVVFALGQKIPEFTHNQVLLSDDEEKEKIYISLYNAAILARDPTIHTIRFEDMIKNKTFNVDGDNVGIYLDYDSHNGHLTQYEYDNIIPSLSLTEDMLYNFNKSAQHCSLTTVGNYEYTTPSAYVRPELIEKYPVGTRIDIVSPPWNLFEKLGYDPLTVKTITAGQS